MDLSLGLDDLLAMQQKLARVQALLEASRQVHSTILLDEVLQVTLDIAVKELEAEGAFFHSASGLNRLHGNVPHDWTQASEWSALPGYSTVPVPGEKGETLGHLVTYRAHPLSFEEADFLEGLALQSAVAVANAQHHERMIEWERVRADLNAARAIQRSLLPQSIPNIPGYELQLRSTTCYEVGGDYVDVVPGKDGRLMMVLADVAGKGLASAMISMTFRSSFRAIVEAGLPLEEMAARMNALHWQEGPEARRRYVTAILLALDPQSHTIQLVNAGHNPAFLLGPDGLTKVNGSGPPLGLLPGMRYQTETFSFQPSGQLFLYTDGLTEVFLGDEEFGEDRLQALLAPAPNPQLLDLVWSTLADFSNNARQTDDMTALYLFRGTQGESA